jgi:uncharacterized glyoxalase superfamily protein PhnB
MPSIKETSPQFLVAKLADTLTFYEQQLGFEVDFVYEGYYASVSRDGAKIHLKCADKLEAERAHRKSGEHLDAYLDVVGVQELHDEFVGRGVTIFRPLADTPWGRLDFYLEDPDGYILCFSEAI